MKRLRYFITIFSVLIIALNSCKDKKPVIRHKKEETKLDTLKPTAIAEKVDSAELKRQEKEEIEWKIHEKEIARIEKEGKKNFVYNQKDKKFLFQLFCTRQKNEIVVFKKMKILKDGKFLQEIKFDVDSNYVYRTYEIDIESNKDCNFDGVNDLQIINWHGMVDRSFSLYIYEKKSEKFKFIPSYSKILNPDIDNEKKEIHSVYHIGPSDYYHDVYKWQSGKFVSVE